MHMQLLRVLVVEYFRNTVANDITRLAYRLECKIDPSCFAADVKGVSDLKDLRGVCKPTWQLKLELVRSCLTPDLIY